MKRFPTLLRREWLQHRRGWIVMMVLPAALILLIGLFGTLQIDLGNRAAEPMLPLPLAAGAVVLVAAATLMLAAGSALLMAPGLARRDAQDRSIEFWVSLPVPHAEAIGATLLAHLLLWPWLALAAGLAGGAVTGIAFVVKVFGFGALAALPWGSLLLAALLFGLRLALGLVLALLWLSPIVLGTMAASAWLKRWGVPALVGIVAFAGAVLQTVYGNPVVWRVLGLLSTQASHALIVARGPGSNQVVIDGADEVAALLAAAPAWLLHDAGAALAQAASPAFVAAVAVGALGFAALWLRRQRGS